MQVRSRSTSFAIFVAVISVVCGLAGGTCFAEIILPVTHSVKKAPMTVYPGGDASFAPGQPDKLYFGGDFYGQNKVYAASIADPVTTPTPTIWANGGLRTGQAVTAGNNVLNSTFGNVAGLVMLDSETAVVVDNDRGTSATIGDNLFLCRDWNHDGDCLDIVTTGGVTRVEVAPFTSTIPGVDAPFGGFAGAQIERAPDGSLLLVTADGDPFSVPAQYLGEVLRVANPRETTSTISIYADYATSPISTVTLQYGGGMDFLPDGSAVVGNSDLMVGHIFKLMDKNNDKDALDAGEAELLATLPHCVFDVAVGSDGMIYATANSPYGDPDPKSRIYQIDPATKQYSVFCDLTPESFFVTSIVFDAKAASFSYANQGRLGRMCVLDGGFLRLIAPRAPLAASNWEMY